MRKNAEPNRELEAQLNLASLNAYGAGSMVIAMQKSAVAKKALPIADDASAFMLDCCIV